MALKRKNSSLRNIPKKRPKYDTSSSSDEESDESSDYWEAECILQERLIRKKLHYQIKWKGTDPATGQDYAPTWEPATNASHALRQAWLGRKTTRQSNKAAPSERTTATSGTLPYPPRTHPRKSRAISSSPEPEPGSPRVDTATALTKPRQLSLGVEQQPHAKATAGGPFRPQTHISPQVVGTQIDPAEYERNTQLPQTEATQTIPDPNQQTDLDSSQLFAEPHKFFFGIVPDSQGSVGEASYVQTTQASTSLHTTLYTDSSPVEPEEDSVRRITSSHKRLLTPQGLLEIAQAALRTASPTHSIPETIDESLEGSQSQAQQEQVEIPDACASELIESTCSNRQANKDVPEGTGQQEPSHGQLFDAPVELRSFSQASTQIEEAEATQPRQQTQSTNQDIAARKEAYDREDQQFTQQETVRSETGEQNTVRRHTRQHTHSDFVDETLQAAQKVHCSVLSESENLEASHLSADASVEFIQTPGDPQKAIVQPQPRQVPEPSGSQLPTLYMARAQSLDNTASLLANNATTLTGERHNSTNNLLKCPDQLSLEKGQFVQFVEPSAPLATQEGTPEESIRPTIEADPKPAPVTPNSQHDTSQETPEGSLESLVLSSPITLPPEHFFGVGTLRGHVPPRPATPLNSSPSLRAMSDHSADRAKAKKEIAERLAALKAKRLANNPPFVPKVTAKLNEKLLKEKQARERRASAASATLASSAPSSSTSPNNSTNRPANMNAPPAPNSNTGGTRSPSTVPDHSPALSAPTSLRAVAFANSRDQAMGDAPPEPSQNSGTGPRPEHAEFVAAVAAAATAGKPAPAPSEDRMQVDDEDDYSDENLGASGDSEFCGGMILANKRFESDEYLVPLVIEGRQKDMYMLCINDSREILNSYTKDLENFEPIAKVDDALARLRGIETHIDLVYAEADCAMRSDIESAARFGVENSAKFKFLRALFAALRDEKKHIAIVTENNDEGLFRIFETFCRAFSVNFDMPTRGICASSEFPEGNLLVSVFPGTASPNMRAVDLIICLDGVHNAKTIRQKDWAAASGSAPVLHLVLPRSLGHVQQYLSPNVDHRRQLEIITLCLAQLRWKIGEAVDEDTPRASAAGEEVATWLLMREEDSTGASWPLPYLGSIRPLIEYEDELSQASAPGSSGFERMKRRMENDDSEQSKRMRFTPQPQTQMIKEENTTPFSPSGQSQNGEESLFQLRQMLEKERAARKAAEERFQEQQVMWERQQEEHENLVREHRLLLGKQKETEAKLKRMTESKESLQERLITRTAEKQALEVQLKEQQAVGLSSSDEMVVEMTRLRKDLAAAKDERQKALKSVQESDTMMDYIKDQYRTAQDAASLSQASVSELTKDNEILARQASGEVAKLKQIHHDRQFDQLRRQNETQRAQISNLQRRLNHTEEELVRARNSIGRQGVGTRAQSATPAPKTRSRAASPMRVSNLRNS